MADNLFRKKAMDKMASPEQLDTALEVTSQRGWLILLTMTVLMGAIVVWLFVGSIADKVSGSGILVGGAAGTLTEIQVRGDGDLVELNIKVGDTVEVGDVLAVVDQPNLEDRVRDAESEVARARNDLSTTEADAQASITRSQIDISNAESAIRRAANDVINFEAAVERNRAALQERGARLEELEGLLAAGRIAQTRVDQVRAEMRALQSEADGLQSQIRSVRAETDGLQGQISSSRDAIASRQGSVRARRNALADAEARLLGARDRDDRYSELTAPIKGVIVDIVGVLHTSVARGEVIARIEPLGEDGAVAVLTPRFWIPAASAGRLTEALPIEISPAGVERAEYGYIRGRIVNVGRLPVSAESAQDRGLGVGLVRDLGSGALTEVIGELQLVDGDGAAFDWSSGSGPPWLIMSGSTIDVQVLVDQKPPIEILIPKLRQFLGIG